MKNELQAKDPVLSVRNLTKTYGRREEPVLKDLSLELDRGTFTLITGKSGLGKSSLLHCIAGLESYDAGSIVLNGESYAGKGVEELARVRLEQIGIVFQFFNLISHLTLAQNILLPADIAGIPRARVQERMEYLVGFIGIGGILERRPHEVSGGEAQRTAIARALLLNPSLVLADEPTGNLDEENSERVGALFQELVRETGTTLLMVSHDKGFSTSADRVLEMFAHGVLQ